MNKDNQDPKAPSNDNPVKEASGSKQPDNLKTLEDKIKDFQKTTDGKKGRNADDSESNNISDGMRAGAELIVPILVAGFIGYHIDTWLGTKPLFLIIFLLLGMGSGFFNVYKITQGIDNRGKSDKD